MGNRLSKITTRTGDDGTTGLGNGERLPKSDLRFDAMGAVDGLNAHIGLLQAHLIHQLPKVCSELGMIQHKLFNIGGEIALPNHREIGYVALVGDDVLWLERQMNAHHDALPYLKEFILPAGSVATAQAHVARSVCRDAERSVIRLYERDGNVSADCMRYLNRLSDYLFVLARVIARMDGGQEVFWQKEVKY